MEYRPEGFIYSTDTNSRYLADIDGLTKAMEKGIILEGKVVLCTSSHDLIVELPCAKGIINREEGKEKERERGSRYKGRKDP